MRVDSSRPAVDKPQFALAGRAHSCSEDTEKEGGPGLNQNCLTLAFPLRTGSSLFSHVSPNRRTSGTLAVGSCRKCDVVLGQSSLLNVQWQWHECCTDACSSSVCVVIFPIVVISVLSSCFIELLFLMRTATCDLCS